MGENRFALLIALVLLGCADGNDARAGFQAARDEALAEAVREARAESEAQGGTSPMLRGRLGDALQRAGQLDEASEHLLWCWDHGLEHSRAYVGVRGSFLVGDLMDLAEQHPATREALEQRFADAEAGLAEAQGRYQNIQDFGALARVLWDDERILEKYDELLARDDLSSLERGLVRGSLFREVSDLLLEAKRYKDILDAVVDPARALRQRRGVRGMGASAAGDVAGLTDASNRNAKLIEEFAGYYEALLGLGRDEEAGGLADLLFELDDSLSTRRALKRHASRAGREDVADAVFQHRGGDGTSADR